MNPVWEHIKELGTQLLGYLGFASIISIIKVPYIKEQGSIWNKIGKFTASIFFGVIIGFLINDMDISEKFKYAIVGGATLISEKIVLYWVENGLSYFKDFLISIIKKGDKNANQ